MKRIVFLALFCLIAVRIPYVHAAYFENIENPAAIIAFCGTYVREMGVCGTDPPQTSGLIYESLSLDNFKSIYWARTPFGMFKTFGKVRTVHYAAPLTRTFWFEKADGTIYNANADLNRSVPSMYIQRKGEVKPGL